MAFSWTAPGRQVAGVPAPTPLWRRSGVNDNRNPCKRRYIAGSSCAPMTELVLLAGVIGLLALIWLGLDSDDDNGGGGLMQPALVPVRVRERR